MRSLSLVTAALALCATSVWAQTTQNVPAATAAPASLQLEVALRGYGADDRARSLAGDSAVEKIDSYVWADRTLCGLGAGNNAPAATPWVGWHFVGTVHGIVNEGGRSAVVFRVEWQRVWENGAHVAEGAKGVSDSSLREGERLELDRVIGGGSSACQTTQVRLEVGAVTRPAYRVGVSGGSGIARAGGRGAAAGGVASGTGSGVGGGAGSGTGSGAGSGVAGGTTGSTTGRNAEEARAFYADALKRLQESKFQFATTPGSYDAELWLVHRHSDGTESTELHQTIQFTGTDVAFTFPAVVVSTSKGDLTLDFSGTLRAGAGPDAKSLFPSFRSATPPTEVLNGVDGRGRSFFFFNSDADQFTTVSGGAAADNAAIRIAVTIARRVRGGGTPPIDTRGGSYFFMNVPAPTDVVSFEFPSLPSVGEDPLKGHTFSLRIRVTPKAK